VRKLEQATDNDVKFLQNWLDRKEGGDFFLRGREASAWDTEKSSDLICLAARYSEKDHLTRWMGDKLIPLFHNRIGHRIKVVQRRGNTELKAHPDRNRMRRVGSGNIRNHPSSP
jgi:hypothetical protein